MVDIRQSRASQIPDVTAEVDRGGSVVVLVRQDGQFVVHPLSNREPMHLLEDLTDLTQSMENVGMEVSI